MSRGKHRKPSTLTLSLLSAGAGTAALVLTGGVALAAPRSSTEPASCVDAMSAYQTAQANQAADKRKLDAANAEFDAATEALAAARSADAAEDSASGAAVDDPAKPDAADQAKSAAESRAFRAGEAQSSAQHTYDADVAATKAARAAADKACTRPVLVDTTVTLQPGVCAHALVTADTRKIVKVLVEVPCPSDKPAPPASESNTSTVQPAPTPTVVDNHLPVTH